MITPPVLQPVAAAALPTRPARTTVEVSDLPGPGLRVEIDAIAVLASAAPPLQG